MTNYPPPKNEREEISKPPDCSQTIREWITILAENFRKDITTPLVNLWIKQLSKFPPASLTTAFQRCALELKFFPSLAEVIERLPQSTAETTEAERAWDALLEHIRKWGADRTPIFHGRDQNYQPIMERADPLDPRTSWAVQQCGGYRAVAMAEQEKMHFIRQDFLQHYARTFEREREFPIGTQEARRLIEQLHRTKQLKG